MGGRVALEMLRLAPQRVVRLALLDSGIDPKAPGVAGADEEAKRNALVVLAQRNGMRAMGMQWARGMVHPSRLDTPLFDEIIAMIERKSLAVYEGQIRALLNRPNGRPVLAGAPRPTLLLCGRQDAWSPLGRHEEMQRLLPGSRLTVIEESGHMATMEQPDAVNTSLLDWLGA
jgi:pimeloyl-ACP methyl ester carboxylesterase